MLLTPLKSLLFFYYINCSNLLVLSQSDLGTSVLIALSGIAVIWLMNKIKYIIYSLLGLVISFICYFNFKNYQKLRILTFLNPNRDPLEQVIKYTVKNSSWFRD